MTLPVPCPTCQRAILPGQADPCAYCGEIPRQLRTSVNPVARGSRNVFVVEVVGRKGNCFAYRSTLTLALATARQYAELLDAPRQVI